jgi:hypothetical protein
VLHIFLRPNKVLEYLIGMIISLKLSWQRLQTALTFPAGWTLSSKESFELLTFESIVETERHYENFKVIIIKSLSLILLMFKI